MTEIELMDKIGGLASLLFMKKYDDEDELSQELKFHLSKVIFIIGQIEESEEWQS